MPLMPGALSGKTSKQKRQTATIFLFTHQGPRTRSSMHQAQVNVFSDSVMCLGIAMNEASPKWTSKWLDNQTHGGTTTSIGMNSKLFDCTFHVNLTLGKHRFSNKRPKRGKFHRHKIFGKTYWWVSPNSHHTDDVNLQNAKITCDHAGQ